MTGDELVLTCGCGTDWRHRRPGGVAVGSGQVVGSGEEVVEGDGGEVGGASAVAHGPHAGEGGFEAIVYLDVAGGRGLDADDFEAHVFRVGRSASGDDQVGALQDGFATGKREVKADGFAGGAFDTRHGGVGDDLDAFVVEELFEAFDDIWIFAVG